MATHHLAASHLSLGYDGRTIVNDLTVEIPTGKVTVIVGANGCGKSTLLRGLARLLKPRGGTVLLDGADIASIPTKKVAQRLGVLPQQPITPDGVTVTDLVSRGRNPHQRFLRQFSAEDEAAVDAALEATGLSEYADHNVDALSGGQRQRAWIALALAQGAPLMLLDEPTTYLDLAHQVDVLNLLSRLNRVDDRTIVMVLHDLNLACRYAHHLIAMRDGAIVAQGTPAEVITTEVVRDVFGLDCHVMNDPLTHTPMVLPIPTDDTPAAGFVPSPGSSGCPEPVHNGRLSEELA